MLIKPDKLPTLTNRSSKSVFENTSKTPVFLVSISQVLGRRNQQMTIFFRLSQTVMESFNRGEQVIASFIDFFFGIVLFQQKHKLLQILRSQHWVYKDMSGSPTPSSRPPSSNVVQCQEVNQSIGQRIN